MTLRYLVVAPSYNPDSGGSIFLHELVHALNSLGLESAIWPMNRMPLVGVLAKARAIWRRPSLMWREPKFSVAPNRNTPIASPAWLGPDTVIVYPEVVLGNPLGGSNIVRWLLYRPGLHDPYSFGPSEMYFRAGEMADLPELTGGAPDLYLWKINPAYQNEGREGRDGACYIVRKGADKPRIPETADAIAIDGLSHEEIAKIFNRCEVFYSYDEATYYSQYAALCGCLSVVVPGLYPSRKEWAEHHPLARYGIAYGLDDLDHARTTQCHVAKLMREQQDASLDTVRRFISLTTSHFNFSGKQSS